MATLRFWYTEAERNGQAANTLKLWHWGPWAQTGTDYLYSESGLICASGGGLACWFQTSSVSTFSPFALGSTTAPTAVNLGSFAVTHEDNHNLIAWETVSELHNLGFNLWRGVTPISPTLKLNSYLIPSQAPGGVDGYAYSYEDNAVDPNKTYYYWLDDMDLNGQITRHGPVMVAGFVPTAVQLNDLHAASTTPSMTSASWLLLAVCILLLTLSIKRLSRI